MSGRWVFLQSLAVMNVYGIMLTSQLMLVTEYMRCGPLDQYLRNNKDCIKSVDLIEATTNLASALYHLVSLIYFPFFFSNESRILGREWHRPWKHQM